MKKIIILIILLGVTIVSCKNDSTPKSTKDDSKRTGFEPVIARHDNINYIAYYEEVESNENQTKKILKLAKGKNNSWEIKNLGEFQYKIYDIDIQIDNLGNTHIVFLHSRDSLIYTTNKSGDWKFITIDYDCCSSWHQKPIIKLSSNNKVHILYQFDTNTLKYASNKNGDSWIKDSWIVEEISNEVNPCAPIETNFSMEIDNNNNLHLIKYYKQWVASPAASKIKYITNRTGNFVYNDVINSISWKIDYKMKIDKNDYIHIFYIENSSPKIIHHIYGLKVDGTGTWVYDNILNSNNILNIKSVIFDNHRNRLYLFYQVNYQDTCQMKELNIWSSCPTDVEKPNLIDNEGVWHQVKQTDEINNSIHLNYKNNASGSWNSYIVD